MEELPAGVQAVSSILGLIVSIVIIVACYNIAESKGRSGAVGAIAGFFCGCIALIFYLLLPDLSHQRSDSWTAGGGTYGGPNPTVPEPPGSKCWSCGATNPTSATHCQTCGTKLKY